MRIGLLAPPWVPTPPPAYGGTESVIDRLARGLVAAGHEVRLFATGDSTCPVDRGWVFDEAQTGRMGSTVAELRHVLAGYDDLRDCDIVHDHTVYGPTFASQFPLLPVVTTNHGPFDEDLRALYRSIADRVPIIAISHDQASTAGGIPIARVIHHGIDVDRYEPGAGDGGYFAFLGRMADEKGVHRAARAARAAGARLLIGAKMHSADEHAFFDVHVKPLLGSGVEYLGELGDHDKMALLRGAQALLNPITWHEPFGLVMIEALAVGTPVIAFSAGAAPEIVSHGISGYLCKTEAEMVGFMGAVDRLDRRACRRSAETDFSTDRMVASHSELFDAVVQRHLSGDARRSPSLPRARRAGLHTLPLQDRRPQPAA